MPRPRAASTYQIVNIQLINTAPFTMSFNYNQIADGLDPSSAHMDEKWQIPRTDSTNFNAGGEPFADPDSHVLA